MQENFTVHLRKNESEKRKVTFNILKNFFLPSKPLKGSMECLGVDGHTEKY